MLPRLISSSFIAAALINESLPYCSTFFAPLYHELRWVSFFKSFSYLLIRYAPRLIIGKMFFFLPRSKFAMKKADDETGLWVCGYVTELGTNVQPSPSAMAHTHQ
jgi:hypothetical protein